MKIVILALFFSLLLTAQARTSVADFGAIPNDGGDDSTSIRSALAAAPSGDTLFFPCGTWNIALDPAYLATFQINKNLTVEGENSNCAVIQTSSTPIYTRLFQQDANLNVQFKHLTINGPELPAGGSAGPFTYGIYIIDSTSTARTTIEDLVFTGRGFLDVVAQSGTGQGDYTLDISGSRFTGTENVEIFSANGANRQLLLHDDVFVRSGISALENPQGVDFGHSVYVHPNVSLLADGCQCLKTVRYCIHAFGSQTTPAPKFWTVANFYFGPQVTQAIYTSGVARVRLSNIDCQAKYGPTLNGSADVGDSTFAPQAGGWALAGFSQDTKVNSCRLIGGDARVVPSAPAGTWNINDSAWWMGEIASSPALVIQSGLTVNVTDSEIHGGSAASQTNGIWVSAGNLNLHHVLFDGKFDLFSQCAPVTIQPGAQSADLVDVTFANVAGQAGWKSIYAPAGFCVTGRENKTTGAATSACLPTGFWLDESIPIVVTRDE